jgi:hypothetical protein
MIDRLRKLGTIIRELEGLLVEMIAATSPWLAPIIPAFMVWQAMTRELGFPRWVALAAACVVECVGLAAVATAFTLWNWNDKRRIKDEKAPVEIAIGTACFYMAVVLTVNVLLDQATWIHRLAKGLLSSLSVVAAVILAIRAQHARRVILVEKEKEELKIKWKENRNLPKVTERIGNNGHDWRHLTTHERKTLSGLSTAKIREYYPDVSERTATNWKNNAHKLRQKEVAQERGPSQTEAR